MYLKGQVLERLGWDKDKILELQDEAIALEESLGAPKSENLAQLYKVKGAILEYLDRKSDAKKFFKLASEVYFSLGMAETAKDIMKHSDQISNDYYPSMLKPIESEANSESSDEEEVESSQGHKSGVVYAILGGALTALSAFALYKARSS